MSGAERGERARLRVLFWLWAPIAFLLFSHSVDASLAGTRSEDAESGAVREARSGSGTRILTLDAETAFTLFGGDRCKEADLVPGFSSGALGTTGDLLLGESRLAFFVYDRAPGFQSGVQAFFENPQRGPPVWTPDLHQGEFVAEPKTRIGGFRLELEDLIKGEWPLSLGLCRGYEVEGWGLAEEERPDPWGLASVPMRQRKGGRGENALVADLLAQGWIIFWCGSKGAVAHPVTGHGPDVFAFHPEMDALAFFDDKNWEKDLVSRVNNLENLEKSKFMDRARDAVLDSELPAATRNRLWNRLNVSSYVPGVTQYKKLVSGAASEAEVERVGPRLKSAGVEFFDVSRKGRVLYGSKVKRMLKRVPYVRFAVILASFLASDDKAEAAFEAADPTGFLGDERLVTTEQEQLGIILDIQRAEQDGSKKRLNVMTEEEWRELVGEHVKVQGRSIK